MSTFFKWILILINLAAVAALVLIKIGSWVSPNDMLLPAYASLFLLPVILIHIAFIFFWALFRKWLLLISLITLILFSGTVKSALPVNFGEIKIDSTRQKITVLSYNTMSTGNMKKHTEENPNPVVEYILNSHADIVCLQELGISDNSHQFREEDFEQVFSMYPYKHVRFKLNKWKMHLGVAILSKYPIIHKSNIDYDADFNLSIYSDIAVKGDTLRVICNHLESNRITAQDMKRTSKLKDDFNSDELTDVTKYLSRKLSVAYKARAKQVDIISEVMKKSPYKLLVCGDFNDVPASYAYTKMKGKLKDAFKETGNGLGWTYTQSLYRFRIDYIMYDPDFQSANYKMGTLKASDHYPIQTDLYLTKKTAQ